jgi:hypothetical protein
MENRWTEPSVLGYSLMPRVRTPGMTFGFRIMVYVKEDGEGPHVHVYKAGTEFRVGLWRDTAWLWTTKGRPCTKAQGRAAETHVRRHLRECWREWKRWHG